METINANILKINLLKRENMKKLDKRKTIAIKVHICSTNFFLYRLQYCYKLFYKLFLTKLLQILGVVLFFTDSVITNNKKLYPIVEFF